MNRVLFDELNYIYPRREKLKNDELVEEEMKELQDLLEMIQTIQTSKQHVEIQTENFELQKNINDQNNFHLYVDDLNHKISSNQTRNYRSISNRYAYTLFLLKQSHDQLKTLIHKKNFKQESFLSQTLNSISLIEHTKKQAISLSEFYEIFLAILQQRSAKIKTRKLKLLEQRRIRQDMLKQIMKENYRLVYQVHCYRNCLEMSLNENLIFMTENKSELKIRSYSVNSNRKSMKDQFNKKVILNKKEIESRDLKKSRTKSVRASNQVSILLKLFQECSRFADSREQKGLVSYFESFLKVKHKSMQQILNKMK